MDSEPDGDSKPHGIATALTSVAKTGEPNGGVPPANALVGDGGWRRLQDEAYYSFFAVQTDTDGELLCGIRSNRQAL